LRDSPALPKPVQRPGPPVIVGGLGARRTPRLAATYAAEYNVPFAPADYAAQQYARVHEACGRIDRDPATVRLSFAQTVCVGADEAEVARRAAAIGREPAQIRQQTVAGTPSEVADRLGEFAAAGATRAYLQILDLDDLDHLELIAAEVMPAVAT
jgi:alkanesulfonate monooxygenase SsuD/methylene tetrahydromethanopterin reductase-like flavin-dependent oxidoreductase (luciferase family)